MSLKEIYRQRCRRDPGKLYTNFLKKSQNAPRPSEHPPVREENMSKRLVR